MQTYKIVLSDVIANEASKQAAQKGLDIGSLLSGVLMDHFLPQETKSVVTVSSISREPSTKAEPSSKLDVKNRFIHYPRLSVDLAQRFADEALKMPRTRAFWSGNGIGFDPNFVFIERLKSRDSGMTVSFFGAPQAHKNRPSILGKGRGESYSRAIVSSNAELESLIPHIRQAYELKFGKL